MTGEGGSIDTKESSNGRQNEEERGRVVDLSKHDLEPVPKGYI